MFWDAAEMFGGVDRKCVCWASTVCPLSAILILLQTKTNNPIPLIL
jgi:hypothetical protein